MSGNQPGEWKECEFYKLRMGYWPGDQSDDALSGGTTSISLWIECCRSGRRWWQMIRVEVPGQTYQETPRQVYASHQTPSGLWIPAPWMLPKDFNSKILSRKPHLCLRRLSAVVLNLSWMGMLEKYVCVNGRALPGKSKPESLNGE